MRTVALRYCNRETLWLAASAVLATTVISGVMLFATAGPRGTALGIHLGADYGAFYTAGLLQNRYGVERLYDLELQDRLLHESVAGFPKADSLPYVYPPFLAPLLRPLATLPYASSFAAWLAVSATLYVAAIGLTLHSCPEIPRRDRATIWLLALSFSPFAVESWLGGQLSVIGAAAVAVAIACHRSDRPVWAGIALAALLYKPTLPGLIVLMLIAGRRWKTLAGFGTGAVVLALASIAVVGFNGTLDYARFLAWYGQQREAAGDVFRSIKFLDLTTCLTLQGLERDTARILALAIGSPVAAALAYCWGRSARRSDDTGLLWGATLCFLPVLTNYGPIYDAAIAVPGLILAADAVRRRNPDEWPRGFLAVIGAAYAAGLASPFLASKFGVQALTPALAAAGIYLLRETYASREKAAQPPLCGDSSPNTAAVQPA